MFDTGNVPFLVSPEDQGVQRSTDLDHPNGCAGRLRREAEAYRERYGEIPDLDPLSRLDHALAVRVARLEHLRRIAAEVGAEMQTHEREIEGIERAVEALLRDVLPAVARRFNEAWSPTPVLGYRLWAWNRDGLHGVRSRWDGPRFTATCPTTNDSNEIPHSDGRCGRLGCGVYAAKNPRRLLDEFAPGLGSTFAAGLVALSGKVVEHDDGYRAAEARIVALVAVDRMRRCLLSDPTGIEAWFAHPAVDPGLPLVTDRRVLFDEIVTYLTDEERSRNPWT